jgi:tripartite-type tricarboxylate transporter receptor subunit TctC
MRMATSRRAFLRIRAYAVTAPRRLGIAPDIPTVDEAGLPGFYFANWHGLWVPKGAPADIIEKLAAAVRQTLADPAVRARLAQLGFGIFPPDQQTPEALGAHQRAEGGEMVADHPRGRDQGGIGPAPA